MGKKHEILSYCWEALLAAEGMPSDLPDEGLGIQVKFGNGLGINTDPEEDSEDSNSGHSSMCPITLGYSLTGRLDQPNERPVEDR